jgi:phage tail tape-measure protein
MGGETSGGGAAAGAAIGGVAGSVVPGIGNIIGAIAGATIGGIFDSVQGAANRKQQQKMFNTQQEMAERQFGWGQRIDRFNMDLSNKQQFMQEKAINQQITQSQVDSLNKILQQNTALQDHVRSLWGGR